MNTAWLLTAHLILSTGEATDVPISMHLSEKACIAAMPKKSRRSRRYDCRPMSHRSSDGMGSSSLLDLMDLEEFQKKEAHRVKATQSDQHAEIARLRAENERLREALKLARRYVVSTIHLREDLDRIDAALAAEGSSEGDPDRPAA
jgi:hypothetical protein